jgi:glycogen operon protein
VGEFPPGWAEWNDKYRDTVRDFWRGKAPASALAHRLTASGDVFNHHGRKPWSTVNFVTAHDGFTLNDLVSYNDKHNEANGEDNRDGSSDNRSWNCGAEGPTDDAGVNALRGRQMRNMLATLIFSQGTPMVLGGDEFARTQGGNNNAYCQDNEITWYDWDAVAANGEQVDFFRKLIALRDRYPILRRTRFLTAEYNAEYGIKDLTWIDAGGGEMQEQAWQDENTLCFGMLIDGRAQTTGIRRRGSDTTVLLVFNAYHDLVEFALPPCVGGIGWQLLVDTNDPKLGEGDGSNFSIGEKYGVTAYSTLLFALRPE